jgi:hypothetical protein
MLSRLALLLCLIALFTGCSTDREQAAVGKWKADGSAIGTALRSAKLKSENPDASTGEIMGAARVLGATSVTLNNDKSAEVFVAGTAGQGTWTIDKEAGVVTVNITSAKLAAPAEGQKAGQFTAQTWTCYLNDSNDKMRLYMAPKDIADSLRKDGNEAPGSILLSKRS